LFFTLVYSWGSSTHNGLGVSAKLPTKITAFTQTARNVIAGGNAFIIDSSSDNQFYGFGEASALCYNSFVTFSTPTLLSISGFLREISPFKSIKLSNMYSMVVANNSSVYQWGFYYGFSSSSSPSSPQLVTGISGEFVGTVSAPYGGHIKRVSDGAVLAIGNNIDSAYGPTRSHLPVKIPDGVLNQIGMTTGAQIKKVVQGQIDRWVLNTQNNLHLWTYGYVAQVVTTVTDTEQVADICSYLNVMLMLTASGKLYKMCSSTGGISVNTPICKNMVILEQVILEQPLFPENASTESVTKISCASTYALITVNGKVYEIGNGPAYTATQTFKLINSTSIMGKTILDVKAAPKRALLIDSQGSYYTYGSSL